MTLPSSGPLSLSAIQGEFGGSNPIGLNEYYAGGGLVPSGTIGVNGPVPSSGALPISAFYGTTNFTPVTNTYTSGSGSQSVPQGAQSLTITVIGAGGNGGNSSDPYGGGGGGGGGGAAKTISIAYADYGTTLSYSVAATAASNSTASGSLAAGSISMAATGGMFGGSASGGGGGGGGVGGNGSGGTANVSGDTGDTGFDGGGGGGGNGGFGIGWGNGGFGADPFGGSPQLGGTGLVVFAWT